MDKIFCIGFPKTGTTSLEEALTILGYKTCKGHYDNNHTNYLIGLYVNNDFEEIDRLINYYDAFTDLPWGGTDLYKYLTTKYPRAKFIHTQREVESWYSSLLKMLTKFDSNLNTALNVFHSKGRYGVVYYLKKIINITTLENTKEHIQSYYLESNKELMTHFDNNDFHYLPMNLFKNDGWDTLCAFLNKPIPETKFPHANKAEIQKKELLVVDSKNKSLVLKTKTVLKKMFGN
ncbi:sulfotransferase family protein [Ichthyenterobacterium magnum]|uniref:Sulfotransferase family protein n=1 Tax=Ichthyenterobacterium magnum TaxID=1230530 RepID=A0A420DUJ4_9FLAO|nr:sulfotransferase family protein [Ichthyenterobacterium magnum]RKE97994.1 hypothetical protein BXY80_0059 [Ichthyenterobacterium magnum]